MTALALFGVVILVLLNAFFVASEFALVRVRRSRIEEEANQGDRLDSNALVLVDSNRPAGNVMETKLVKDWNRASALKTIAL